MPPQGGHTRYGGAVPTGMSWLAISDRHDGYFDPRGISPMRVTEARAERPLALPERRVERGSLLIETRLSPEDRPQTLMAYRAEDRRDTSFSLQAIPGGGVIIVHSDAGRIFHAALHHDPGDRTDVLRITYSWDCRADWGQLAIEHPGTDKLFLSALTAPPGFRLCDLQAMAHRPASRMFDSDLVFFAASDTIEPVGPMPTLTGRIPVATPRGYRAVRDLRRGDRLLTLEAGEVPVLQNLRRTVPAFGSFQPVRLRAPYYGLRHDILVAPTQRLVLRGSDVEYMFGKEGVLVPAMHLVNGTSALRWPGPPTITYWHPVLPGHEAMMTADCLLESLYIGRIRRKRAPLAASLLAGFDRAELPEHGNSAYLVLKPFEAITLADQRAA